MTHVLQLVVQIARVDRRVTIELTHLQPRRQEPVAAAAELERTVREHHFVGALVNNATEDGSMYDDERFWPVFEKAVDLDVPVYLHPSYPAEKLSSHYAGHFTPMAKVMVGDIDMTFKSLF